MFEDASPMSVSDRLMVTLFDHDHDHDVVDA
jgi:hypothetical protein